MIYITAAAITALVLVSVASLHVVGQMIRSQARERQLLLDRIMHLAGRTWTPPPAEQPDQVFDPDEVLPERFVLSPGQLPDDDTY